MRIISGKFKSRRLFSAKGFHVRPTKDKHRESIFNIIFPFLENAIVLDLFAGTGALGIEALSRGSQYAVFVDDFPGALSTINKNIQLLHLESVTKVFKWNILKNLNCLKPYSFDLVFMDPPYSSDSIKPALTNLQLSNCLKNKALIVVEHSFYEHFFDNLPCFNLLDQRRYGKTLVSFLNFVLINQV